MKVLIFGAGAIGGYIGGALLASGVDVTFLVRPSVAKRFDEHGLTLTDFTGGDVQLRAPIPYQTDLQNCPQADVVLLTVKCIDVEDAARELADWVKPSTVVVCLQNGVGSPQRATALLGETKVLAGMVPFNVLTMDGGRLHRGTEGELKLEAHPATHQLIHAWRQSGVPASVATDFSSIAWGKLLLNLNNAINALAGIPLVQELGQRPYRRVLAATQTELLRALKAAGIRPARLAGVPPFLIPWILRLPDWLFRLVARRMLAIDPLARSSMWEDLERRRLTEIDFLNGAVVRLAEENGLQAPVNSDILSLVKEAERAGEGSPGISGQELAGRLL